MLEQSFGKAEVPGSRPVISSKIYLNFIIRKIVILNQTMLDEDIGYVNKPLQNPIKRFGARGIVQKDGKIALLFKKEKNKSKLLGGEIEND